MGLIILFFRFMYIVSHFSLSDGIYDEWDKKFKSHKEAKEFYHNILEKEALDICEALQTTKNNIQEFCKYWEEFKQNQNNKTNITLLSETQIKESSDIELKKYINYTLQFIRHNF